MGHEHAVDDRGAFTALVEVTDGVRRGLVASTKGRWPRDTADGATVNATVAERDADMGGGAVYHDNRVEMQNVEERHGFAAALPRERGVG